MTQLYSSIVVALAAITHALVIPSETIIDWGPPVHVLQFTLMTCDNGCRCLNACAHLNYSNGRLQCELIQRNFTDQSLYLEGTLGYLRKEDNDFPSPGVVSEPTNSDCFSLGLLVCPRLVTNDSSVVIVNLTAIIRDQRLVQFTSHGQDGWNTDSCTAYSECSHYNTRKMQSTIQMICQSDSECTDAETECRRGQCWCKPGLSHDPDRLACVPLCPGQYGLTFQIHVVDIENYDISLFSNTYWDHFDVAIDHCKGTCINFFGCRFAQLKLRTNGFYSCLALHTEVMYTYAADDRYTYVYLQRDCESMVN